MEYGLLGQQPSSGLLGNQPWFWNYGYQPQQPSFGSGRAGDIQQSVYNNYAYMPTDYQVGGLGLMADLMNPQSQEQAHARLLKPNFFSNFGEDPLRYL